MFGPDARGPLIIEKTPSGWTADFIGRTFDVGVDGTKLAFDLPNREGSFSGHMSKDGRRIAGQWITPNSRVHGSRYASPVVLDATGRDRWSGTVSTRDTHSRFI